MTVKKTLSTLLALSTLAVGTQLFGLNTLKAQEISTITVFPAVQDIKVNPGERTRTQIQFRNASDEVISGQIKVADYVIGDKNGTPYLIEDQALKPKYSASSWIKPADDFIAIPKNEIVGVNMTITPPRELTSCGYYALVYFQPDAGQLKRLGGEEKSSASQVTTKIGALINFVVNNKTCIENIEISKLEGATFQEYGPISINYDLLNTGDIHLSPRGLVNLTDFLGKYVDSQTLKEQRIFPERAKEYKASIGQKWMIGKYKINVSASYGDGKTVNRSIYVWVFPWKIALAVLLSIIVITLIVKNMMNAYTRKEAALEAEVKKEREEIEELKKQIRKRGE